MDEALVPPSSKSSEKIRKRNMMKTVKRWIAAAAQPRIMYVLSLFHYDELVYFILDTINSMKSLEKAVIIHYIRLIANTDSLQRFSDPFQKHCLVS